MGLAAAHAGVLGARGALINSTVGTVAETEAVVLSRAALAGALAVDESVVGVALGANSNAITHHARMHALYTYVGGGAGVVARGTPTSACSA